MKIFELKASLRDRWGNTQLSCSVFNGSLLHNENYPDNDDLKLNLIQEKWTKLTNFLSNSTISALGFILDDKAKQIIQAKNITEHRFYETPLEGKNGEQQSYYWLHFFENRSEILKNVDWTNSTFMKTEILKKHGEIKINSAEEYVKLSSENTMISYKPEKLSYINTTVLEKDMFTLGNLYHSVFISEKMKTELENAKISGITISEVSNLFH